LTLHPSVVVQRAGSNTGVAKSLWLAEITVSRVSSSGLFHVAVFIQGNLPARCVLALREMLSGGFASGLVVLFDLIQSRRDPVEALGPTRFDTAKTASNPF
jgi:hypothetical protein